MNKYIQENKETIDRWCRDGWEWSVPVSHEEFVRAKQGDCQLFLTPTKPIPRQWLGELTGKTVLALASGGGQQGPLLTALGAQVTVLDFSDEQLMRERIVAQREGYEIQLVQADMSQPLPFADSSFDLIVHPVSNVYVRDVLPIWRECFRVLKRGGALLSGLDNGINFILDDEGERVICSLPFDPLINPEHRRMCQADGSGFQFSHGLEEQIGGQLKAGFTLLDLYEDSDRTGNLHDRNIPQYFATFSRKETHG